MIFDPSSVPGRIVRIAAAVLLLMLAVSAQGQDRKVALVIGNGAYRRSTVSPLTNPPNDGRDVGAALRRLGFEVREVIDGTHEQMSLAIDTFGRDLQRADVGLFYYAGHGVQVNGINYLIPVDAELPDASLVRFRTVAVDEVLAYMEGAGTDLNLFFLDACRDNPLPSISRTLNRGLAVVGRRPPETMIVYATAANEVADDGRGRNSPFTQAFLNHVVTPGQDVYDLYRSVSVEVQRATGGRQRPELFGNVTGRYALVPAAVPTPAPPAPSNLTTAFGSIKVLSASAGVIYLHGVAVGTLRAGQSVTLSNVEAGNYVLEVRYADGEREFQSVTVPAGSTATVSFRHMVKQVPTPARSKGRHETSGVALSTGYGYEYAGLGAAAELYLHWQNVGLGAMLGVGYFRPVTINGIETDGAVGIGIGARLVLGSRHRFVVDLHYGLAGVAARETTDRWGVIRETVSVPGTTAAVGYQLVDIRGFMFQISVGQTSLVGAEEWVTDLLGDQIPTLNIGVGYKIN